MAKTSRLLAHLLLFGFVSGVMAAPLDRVTRSIDVRRSSVLPGHLRRQAQARFDRGAVDPGTRMNDLTLLARFSAAQQEELNRLIADQQTPFSPLFHKWITPEEFGNRFGLSPSDESKVAAWLSSSGFKIEQRARGRNWIRFSGPAGQVARVLQTSIHRFDVDGEVHYAAVNEPSVPDALADVVTGFLGLDDFHPLPMIKRVNPEFNVGNSHFLAPEDYATIYNLSPLYQAGMDGSGQSIAVVGQSQVLLSDIRAFRTRYNLPANDPKLVLYSTDPGFNGAQIEGNLDLEWAGAIAPKAAITYVYGPSAFSAIVFAVNSNIAPIISISYGTCELNASPTFYRAIAQQANAQGITLFSASGDSGAAGCDRQDVLPFANLGRMVDFPAVLPEVTAVGGTQFMEGTGNYWAPANSPNFGSALSYIPETAWNESDSFGLASSGGGASVLYPRPAWQNGPGVPNDTARHIPDISLTAAAHDAYLITYMGSNVGVAGTSASTPAMAGIAALLTQYLIANGFQKQPGLGNINPQLYRLARVAPSAFHDIITGSNVVPCAQGSPDCSTGAFGYQAGPGYDRATGLGSIDANALVRQWNTATQAVVVTLSANATTATLNDTLRLIATVTPAEGSGTPTGTIDFIYNGNIFGSVPVTGSDVSVSFPLYQLGVAGTVNIAAAYSGDASFSSGGATARIQVTTPVGAATIIPSAPNTVWAQPADAAGLSWQTTLSLREASGIPALLTEFTIDGKVQKLADYFPSPNIPPSETVSTTLVFRTADLPASPPLVRNFGFSGVDAMGKTWSRQISVNYLPLPTYNYFNVSATPLVVAQNLAAEPACQWSTQLHIDDLGGFGVYVMSALFAGGVNLTAQVPTIFGSRRLDAYGSLQGTLCFGGVTPPATNSIQVNLSSGVSAELAVSFTGPPANPAKLSVSPSSVSLNAPDTGQPAQTTLQVNLSDKATPWIASVFPANRTTSWLKLSQYSGTGPGQIKLTASGGGFEPGAYRAAVVIETPNAVPQYMTIPVMFVLGTSTSGTEIDSVFLYASPSTTSGSPGTLLSIYGKKLANTSATASGNPVSYSLEGVTATVNGLAAPVVRTRPEVVDIQVPYEAGAGPAVVGINNNGQIAGYEFQIAPAAPGIITDGNGNVAPISTVEAGGYLTLFVTGIGDVSPSLKTAFSPSSTTNAASLPRPLLPLSVTVGGVPAFVSFAGIASGLLGTGQVNVLVPATVPLGTQRVVVTVGGAASLPVNVVVQ
jgi:uncharacterized protein (TIGR03437 family)